MQPSPFSQGCPADLKPKSPSAERPATSGVWTRCFRGMVFALRVAMPVVSTLAFLLIWVTMSPKCAKRLPLLSETVVRPGHSSFLLSSNARFEELREVEPLGPGSSRGSSEHRRGLRTLTESATANATTDAGKRAAKFQLVMNVKSAKPITPPKGTRCSLNLTR